jgi:hypothetical protein
MTVLRWGRGKAAPWVATSAVHSAWRWVVQMAGSKERMLVAATVALTVEQRAALSAATSVASWEGTKVAYSAALLALKQVVLMAAK